ncbi:hypothetical protein [Pseudomonas gozinkensis]|uniref:hypothetical protein n=1 Tax=Pseudomonas gozinkensis TaxID=2774461 RepID=UPI001787F9B9|nr:hypothetical protein [Pseudomonas gozinkensis]
MITWTSPKLLTQYRSALQEPGIYIIGGPRDKTLPVTSSISESDELGRNWPDNFTPYYIGISESTKTGVRGRLRSHQRRRGNNNIADRVRDNDPLYFIADYGIGLEAYEALFLCLKNDDQFPDNIRCELDRSAKRQYNKVMARVTSHDRAHYERLDPNEHM